MLLGAATGITTDGRRRCNIVALAGMIGVSDRYDYANPLARA